MQSRSLSTGRGLDPFDVMRQDFEAMFDRLSGNQGQGLIGQLQRNCPVEIVETGQEYRIIAELPGMTERDIEITTTGDSVTIQGYKYSQYQQQGQTVQTGQVHGQHGQSQQSQDNNKGSVLISERSYGEFRRMFTLPQHVDRDRISANVSNGLLTITVPKSSDAQRQQRRIEVRSGGQNQTQQNR